MRTPCRLILLVSFTCVLMVDRVSAELELPPAPPMLDEVLQRNKELIGKSDLVAKLRVESVQRWTSYGAGSIDLRNCWYVARCRVVKVWRGGLPDKTETVDVLLCTRFNATVFGFYSPPMRADREGFANNQALVRRPSASGKPEPFELVAFLRQTVPVAPLNRPKDPPILYVPMLGHDQPEKALISLSRTKLVIPD